MIMLWWLLWSYHRNRLKLNADKSQFMWAGTRQQRVKVTAKCQQRSTAWSAHCNVKQCHVSGRRTRLRVDTGTPRPLLLPATPPMGGPLRRTLSADNNAKTLVCALVTNRVDYCNGVLYHVVTWLPLTCAHCSLWVWSSYRRHLRSSTFGYRATCTSRPANRDSDVWSAQLRQRGTVVLEQSQPSTEVVLSPHGLSASVL